MTDTELLDALQAMHVQSGKLYVICRESTTGRGWRLHSLDDRERMYWEETVPDRWATTVRCAIHRYVTYKQEARG